MQAPVAALETIVMPSLPQRCAPQWLGQEPHVPELPQRFCSIGIDAGVMSRRACLGEGWVSDCRPARQPDDSPQCTQLVLFGAGARLAQAPNPMCNSELQFSQLTEFPQPRPWLPLRSVLCGVCCRWKLIYVTCRRRMWKGRFQRVLILSRGAFGTRYCLGFARLSLRETPEGPMSTGVRCWVGGYQHGFIGRC